MKSTCIHLKLNARFLIFVYISNNKKTLCMVCLDIFITKLNFPTFDQIAPFKNFALVEGL